MLNKLFSPDVLESFRRKWIQIGLVTDPVDRELFAQRIGQAYALADLDMPKRIIWFDSPMAAIVFVAVLRNLKLTSAQVSDQVLAQVLAQVSDQVSAQVRAQVRDQVSAQVLAQVSDQVLAQVLAQVRDQVSAQVLAQVRDQVSAQVLAQVSDQVSAQVRAQVRDQVLAQVSAQVSAQVRDQVLAQVSDQVSAQVRDLSSFVYWRWGSYDEYWLSYCDVFLQTQTVLLQDQIQQRLWSLIQVREASGIFFPFREIVVCSDNPCILQRDKRGRLHNESGMAIRYRDGWGVYAVHGVRVPEYVIEHPNEITVQDIEHEQNAEIRRVKIERYGQRKFLLDSNARLIHADDYGALYRKEIQDDEPLVMVKVVNSTPEGHYECTDEWEMLVEDGEEINRRKTVFVPDLVDGEPVFKDYFLRVPPNMQTAREAVAWTFDMTSEHYAPVFQS